MCTPAMQTVNKYKQFIHFYKSVSFLQVVKDLKQTFLIFCGMGYPYIARLVGKKLHYCGHLYIN